MINGTGRRKCSVARVYLSKKGSGQFQVNNKDISDFFVRERDLSISQLPLQVFDEETLKSIDVKVSVRGGGTSGQAGSISMGLARAIVNLNPEMKIELRKSNLLTRDSRMVERKKPGRVKARKVQQFKKR